MRQDTKKMKPGQEQNPVASQEFRKEMPGCQKGGTSLFTSEQWYRRLFESAKDGILILDAETGRVMDVNPFLINLLGYAHENFLGKKVWELGFLKDILANEAHFTELQANEYIRCDDLPLTTRTGQQINVEFASIVYEVNGHKVIQCNIRDITARKRAEESRARLAKAVGQATETILITDTQGTILYVNPAFEKSTGYTRVEAIGQNVRMLRSGRQDAGFYQQLWDTIMRGEVWAGHFSNKRKDGMLYEEEVTISPICDANEVIVNYVAVKRDVTNEMALEAQLRQSQKMEAVGTLAGGVAHDFNNILAIIQMEVGLLKNRGGLSSEQIEYADEISGSIDRAAALTRQLLLFSRKASLQLCDLDLNQVTSDLAKMLRRILGEDIGFQLQLAAQPMFIHADPTMMNQVLMNLVVNARDALHKGGQLVVTTAAVEVDESTAAQTVGARSGSFVCLSVADTGSGISPQNLRRIFEPFFTTKGVGKGTGLGLPTVFGIVQQHHGWINVSSEVGQGTTFKIYLPRLAEMADQKNPIPIPATPSTGTETLLLVEDEPLLRLALQKNLTRLGYHILAAPNGVKAMEVWQKHREEIRLMLTDMVMPGGMNGKELAQCLLQKDPKLKVVYMSGYRAEVAGKDLSLQEGVNFLFKPFPIDQLAQIIRDSLDKK
jgi:PAS domain S-box-containing protein